MFCSWRNSKSCSLAYARSNQVKYHRRIFVVGLQWHSLDWEAHKQNLWRFFRATSFGARRKQQPYLPEMYIVSKQSAPLFLSKAISTASSRGCRCIFFLVTSFAPEFMRQSEMESRQRGPVAHVRLTLSEHNFISTRTGRQTTVIL